MFLRLILYAVLMGAMTGLAMKAGMSLGLAATYVVGMMVVVPTMTYAFVTGVLR